MLLFTLILGALLRLYNNTAIALWHDEAFSALYIRYPFAEMMHRIALDVHPPLYYLVLLVWTKVFGQSLFSLRSLSILFGTATIFAGYLFVKQISASWENGRKAKKFALLAAFLLAINPFQIQYSLEARMYTLGTFLILLSSYFLIKAIQTNQTKWWLWYGLSVVASFYTHYYLIFSVAAQGLYLIYLFVKAKKINLKAIGAYALVFLLYLPWIPTLLRQIKRVEQAYWIPAPDRWSIPGTIWKMAFGGAGIDRFVLVWASIVALILIYYFLKKINKPEKWLILFSIIVPFVGAMLLSFKTAIYLDRYFVFASLFFTILIALTLYSIPRYSVRRTLTALFIIMSLIAFFKNWKDLDIKNLVFGRQENRKPGMAAASTVVNDQASPSDKIYVGSSFIYFTFKYYNQTGIHPLLISSGPLASIPHFSGTALLNNDDLILTDQIKKTAKNENVWLVWTTGFGSNKPSMPVNFREVSESVYPDSPGFKGEIYITQYHVN